MRRYREYFDCQCVGYKKEAIRANRIQLFVYLVVLLILTCLSIAMLNNDYYLVKFMVCMCIVFEIGSCFTVYNVAFLIGYDLKKRLFETKTIEIKSVEREISYAGRQGVSFIGRFFRKGLSVNRYKICYKEGKRKKYVRLLLGVDEWWSFFNFVIENQETGNTDVLKFNVTYLKNSKVLYDISPVNDDKKNSIQKFLDSLLVLELIS